MLDIIRNIEAAAARRLPMIEVTDDPDIALEKYEQAKTLKANVTEYMRIISDGVVEYVAENGAIPCGEEWLIAAPQTTRSVRPEAYATLMAELLDACDGDMEQLAECLSKTAFNLTPIRRLLGERVDQFLEAKTTEKPVVRKTFGGRKAIGGAS